MKIALINENSQAAKNGIIYNALKKVADEKGYDVDNYGMYSADDKAQLTYVQNGILAAILLNSGAADFVVTGCGTGEGAMLALNSFPGVICGHVTNPLDAYTFAQSPYDPINRSAVCNTTISGFSVAKRSRSNKL
jgi:ribose 5-phosphate isomerase RpiB